MKLDKYKQALYSAAKRQDTYKKYTIYTSIFFLLSSFYLQGVYIYYPSVFAFILQVVAWYFSWKAKETRRLAHNIQTVLMLETAYGKVAETFNLSSLIASLPKNIHEVAQQIKDEDNYNIGVTTEPEDRLLKMIQSNTYWNYHLYGEEYKKRVKTIILVLLIFIVGIAISLPFIKLDNDYTIVRVFIAIASLSIFYELVESVFILKRSSLSMREIDNEISRITNLSHDQLIGIFAEYSNITLENPDISDDVYKRNETYLKHSWEYRLEGQKT